LKKIVCITTAAGALMSGAAFAQSEAGAQEIPAICSETIPCTGERDAGGTAQREIIVTANGAPTLPERVGQAVTLVNQAEIELRQPSTISDLLAQTPGVTVSNTGPIGGFSAVRIRGAEGEQTLALIDGVRLNDPSSPGGGFDFANLLVGNINRVEVLRGPNSVPWGSQAIGGVVNVITQSPTYETEAGARAEYGSNDRANLVGNVSGKSGPVWFSLPAGLKSMVTANMLPMAASSWSSARGSASTCAAFMRTAVSTQTGFPRPFSACRTRLNIQRRSN
jgi:outer membrane cobalamin receptor